MLLALCLFKKICWFIEGTVIRFTLIGLRRPGSELQCCDWLRTYVRAAAA